MAKREIVEVEMWRTVDGLVFSSERQALEYEQRRKDSKIRATFHRMKLTSSLTENIGDWILIRNEAELDYIIRYVRSYHKKIYTHRNKSLSLGDWVGEMYDYEEGERSFAGLITLERVLSDMESFVEAAEKLTVDGKY